MKCHDTYPTWKGYLFRLQQEAPQPRPVLCNNKYVNNLNRPHFYGEEYHGLISRVDAEALCSEEGNFLIRESQTERGRFTLVMRVLNLVKNFKLYWVEGKHYVGEKKFDSVRALVQDGLITMYVENKAQDYIEKMSLEPVYSSLSRYSSVGSRHGNKNEHLIYCYHSNHNTPSPTEETHFEETTQKYPFQLYYDEQADSPSDRFYDREFFYNCTGNEGFKSGDDSPHTPDVSSQQSGWEMPRRPNGGYCRYQDDISSKFSLALPEEARRRIEVGVKKNLTPTSSDERKKHKKRIATEDSVFGQRVRYSQQRDLQDFEQEKLTAVPKNKGKPRRTSHEVYGSRRNDDKLIDNAIPRRLSANAAPYSPTKQSTYHQPTVAQKQTTNMAHVRHLNAGFDNKANANGSSHCKAMSTADIGLKKIDHRNSPHNHLFPSQDETSSLDHLMDIHKQVDAESRHCDVMRDIINDLEHRNKHMKPHSDTAEHWPNEKSDGNFAWNQTGRVHVEHLIDNHQLTNKHLTRVERPESVGSYESAFSCGSSKDESSSSSYSHDSGVLFSDSNIVSSSPRHCPGFHRCISDSPQLHHSPSPCRQQSRTGRIQTRFAESPWQHSSDAEDKFSRSRSSSSNRKRVPLSPVHPTSKDTKDMEKTTTKKNHESSEKYSETSHRFEPHDSSPQHSPKNKTKFEKPASGARRSVGDRKSEFVVSRETPNGDMTSQRHDGKSGKNNDLMREKSGKQKQGKKTKLKIFSPTKSKKSPVLTPTAQLTSSSRRHCALTSSPLLCERSGFSFASQYEKGHNFKPHTYRMPQWCEYCGNYLWGLIQQGMQCIDCGLNVHKQCSKLVPSDCQPALKHVKRVFGIDLTTLVKLHDTQHPIVVDMCIEEIERRGMNFEGIYKSSEFHDDVLELKAAFDQIGPDVNLSSYKDITTLAGALKLYLREIPVPLLPYQLYSRFINAAKISYEDGKLDAIRMGLGAMPGAHLQTLKHLILHLGRISEGSFLNQMSSEELGRVFGSILLRTPEKEVHAQYINDSQYQQDVVATMIDFRHFLFGTG